MLQYKPFCCMFLQIIIYSTSGENRFFVKQAKRSTSEAGSNVRPKPQRTKKHKEFCLSLAVSTKDRKISKKTETKGNVLYLQQTMLWESFVVRVLHALLKQDLFHAAYVQYILPSG